MESYHQQRYNLTSSFPISMPFIFSVALAGNFSTMLNRSGKNRYPCLVLVQVKGNAFNFFKILSWTCALIAQATVLWCDLGSLQSLPSGFK